MSESLFNSSNTSSRVTLDDVYKSDEQNNSNGNNQRQHRYQQPNRFEHHDFSIGYSQTLVKNEIAYSNSGILENNDGSSSGHQMMQNNNRVQQHYNVLDVVDEEEPITFDSDDFLESNVASNSSSSSSEENSPVQNILEDTTLYHISRAFSLMQSMLPQMVGFGQRHQYSPNNQHFARIPPPTSARTSNSAATSNRSLSSSSSSILFDQPFKRLVSSLMTLCSIVIIMWNGIGTGIYSYGMEQKLNQASITQSINSTNSVRGVDARGVASESKSYNFISQPHEVSDFGKWGIHIDHPKKKTQSTSTLRSSSKPIVAETKTSDNDIGTDTDTASDVKGKETSSHDKKKKKNKKKKRRPSLAQAQSLDTSSLHYKLHSPSIKSDLLGSQPEVQGIHHHKTSEFILTDDDIKHASSSSYSPRSRSSFWRSQQQQQQQKPPINDEDDEDGSGLTTQRIMVPLAWFFVFLVIVETILVEVRRRVCLSQIWRQLGSPLSFGFQSTHSSSSHDRNYHRSE